MQAPVRPRMTVQPFRTASTLNATRDYPIGDRLRGEPGMVEHLSGQFLAIITLGRKMTCSGGVSSASLLPGLVLDPWSYALPENRSITSWQLWEDQRLT